MNYQIFSIIFGTAFLWGVADLLRKTSSGNTNNQLLAFMFNLGAAIPPFLALAYFFVKKTDIELNTHSAIISLIGGLFAGGGSILLFYLLSQGTMASIAFPLIRIISLIIVIGGGILFFREPITWKVSVGIVFAFIGIFFLLTK